MPLELELVTEGLKFPEGPIAMADGSVVLVEINRQTLTRVRPDGKQEIIARLGGGPDGVCQAGGKTCLLCLPAPSKP